MNREKAVTQTFGVEIEMNNITRQTERLLHLERLDGGRQRMEVPEGCVNRRTGFPQMRDGHPHPLLRGHGSPAGVGQNPPQGRGSKRLDYYLYQKIT